MASALIFYLGALRQTVEGMRQAKAKGAHRVGITDTFVSPIARFADECFIVSVETCHLGDSYAGPMALLNIILVACAIDDTKRRKKRVLFVQHTNLATAQGSLNASTIGWGTGL